MSLSEPQAAGSDPRRLFFYSSGFLTQGRLRHMLAAAGWRLSLGLPGPSSGDAVAVWGHSPTAARGEAVATRRGVPLVRIEDAFLRSVHPGRSRCEPPLGLLIDETGGAHYASAAPSALEVMLARHPLDDAHLLQRARDGMGRLKALNLSKYNNFDPALPPPDPGYVLVIDQTRGDASIRLGGARESVFREMLVFAQEEHPGARIVIKSHPETHAGHRPGHYGPEDAGGRITLLTDPVSPWALLEGAVAVYTVSSQMGFEAILAGHRPRVFGQPFYAGWGLTGDENPVPRRQRKLTKVQLFAAAMVLAPVWYDPCRGKLCSFEQAVDQMEAETRAFREDRHGHVAVGMRLWKRAPLQKVFGREVRLVFENDPARAAAKARQSGRGLLVWAGKETPALVEAAECLRLARVEDGFLRSRGLGAELVPPLSLVTDPLGIYYDPSRESLLERLIAAPPPPGGLRRAEDLVAGLIRAGVTKYNLGGALPPLPEGHRILVPGQVEDDASILRGGGEVRHNLDLLQLVRAKNPGAVVIFKPHPDVEAGLRPGAVAEADLRDLADAVVRRGDPAALLAEVAEVWTMTSLLGFEALLRGLLVTCLGAPFYAGWGLTTDLGPVPARRQTRVTLLQLAHAALIAYPRYTDPVTGLPCPPEVVAERLASGTVPHPGAANRALAKLQGAFASQSRFWR
ncbi:capsular polysaccharide biosynthesis protein [Frigidibacter sp.]|uniref:capsular polysaccharide biosynthesis protein n=1 Tax=Frigidibacter sp. TaxID=2586418 RepID=UPI0027336DFB|nr:capsular polysaccharide biosynthesis protein [Frigidibacter sp.]MDP3340666.1 capsular polysaccharide biosynthesis protein [Frigidibacter sp.]